MPSRTNPPPNPSRGLLDHPHPLLIDPKRRHELLRELAKLARELLGGRGRVEATSGRGGEEGDGAVERWQVGRQRRWMTLRSGALVRDGRFGQTDVRWVERRWARSVGWNKWSGLGTDL